MKLAVKGRQVYRKAWCNKEGKTTRWFWLEDERAAKWGFMEGTNGENIKPVLSTAEIFGEDWEVIPEERTGVTKLTGKGLVM